MHKLYGTIVEQGANNTSHIDREEKNQLYCSECGDLMGCDVDCNPICHCGNRTPKSK